MGFPVDPLHPLFPMKLFFIIYISSRLSFGSFPRLDGFEYSEKYGKYIYLGRELNQDEFNAAAATVFSPSYRNNGFLFCPEILSPAPAAVLPPVEEPTEPPPTPEGFRFEGRDIMLGDERVGGVFDPGSHIRVAKGKSAIRSDLESWLATQTIPE
jgi:hypothetical protein